MKVSIIIPNYNGEELLKKNLPSVFAAASYYADKHNQNVEIIVVDDCSEDDSIKAIESSKFRVQSNSLKLKVIKNETNLGFSSTVNKGVREANGEIVVLLNTDVVPEKDFLDPLISHFANENVFAVGCMDKSAAGEALAGEAGGPKIVLRGRGIGFWKRGMVVHKRGEVDNKTTLWVAGGSGAFRKKIWEQLGGLDILYNPFYWEDIDISYRAQKAGFKVLFEPKSVVIHHHEEGAIKTEYSSSQVKTIAFRNQFIFIWKNITDVDLLYSHLFWLPYHFGKALMRFDTAFFYGFLFAILRLPAIIAKRNKQMIYCIKNDKEILAEFFKDI